MLPAVDTHLSRGVSGFWAISRKKKPLSPKGISGSNCFAGEHVYVLHTAASLRRYYPDQVLRVGNVPLSRDCTPSVVASFYMASSFLSIVESCRLKYRYC